MASDVRINTHQHVIPLACRKLFDDYMAVKPASTGSVTPVM